MPRGPMLRAGHIDLLMPFTASRATFGCIATYLRTRAEDLGIGLREVMAKEGTAIFPVDLGISGALLVVDGKRKFSGIVVTSRSRTVHAKSVRARKR
ncbi:MAG: hypothetical protein H6833_04935 [Planctomycetes bacterium]|nr:hypothetical protein [Planctomycetota bacterium]